MIRTIVTPPASMVPGADSGGDQMETTMLTTGTTSVVLENRWLTAEFDPQSGNLLRLLDRSRDEPVVAGCWCGFTINKQAVAENPQAPGERFTVESVTRTDDGVESTIATAHVRITRRFTLPPDSSLLQIHYAVRSLHHGVELTNPIALPEIVFAPGLPGAGFTDQFEDVEDLYFDGAEIGDGRELPPWRVFFREDHQAGLIAATRSKLEMSHFQIVERSFSLRPHVMTAYSTDYVLARSPMRLLAEGESLDDLKQDGAWTDMPADYRTMYMGPRTSHEASFEIGPWRKQDHEKILAAARLAEPSPHRHPPITGQPPKDLKGVVIRIADVIDKSAVSEQYQADRWLLAEIANCTGGRALYANTTCRPPSVVVHPRLAGVYRVYVGAGQGNGVVAKLSGDPMPMFRLIHGDSVILNPFKLRLSGVKKNHEALLKTARMDGQSIELRRLPSTYAATVLDYLRFEKLSEAEVAQWERIEQAEPAVELSGFNDIPDIATLDDSTNPDPVTYEANLWEHAQCKLRKVYWRIDGQCSDFPSKTNTMRYVSAKTHGLFTPQNKSYGRALLKFDMLKLAVSAARKYGLKLYGWQRFNNYSGNVQSEFYTKHPEFHEADDQGRRRPKLCLGHPEVRKHKIDILCEAAAYGLDGLNLGFLRHPPVLHYAPVLVTGYREKQGKNPPPEPAADKADQIQTQPEQFPEYQQWYQHRAQYLTIFGRELRAALKQRNLGHVKISIWVRPERCLYDGIDIDAWLDEKLCDEVVGATLIHCLTKPMPEAWRRKVQARVPLISGISAFDFSDARESAPRAIREGYDGVCTYESDYAVLEDVFIDLYRGLRKPT